MRHLSTGCHAGSGCYPGRSDNLKVPALRYLEFVLIVEG